MRNPWMRAGWALVAAAVLLPGWAGADPVAEAMRAIVAKNGAAVVQVKLTVKQSYTMPEYGTDVSEFTQEVTATVISPEGLMVTSLMHTDPSSWMDDMFAGEDGYSSKTEITGLKALHGEQEVDAEIVLRDRDLDLAFLRPVTKPDAPQAYVDLSGGATAQAFDEVVTLHRLGKVAQRLATANVMRIGAVQERPRLTYILGEYSGMGTPVFLTSGACLGINVTRILRGNGPNGMGVHDEYDMNMASVVIPGADILEIAKQAPAYKTD
ncbi:MAG: trypsin-like peptidase domain-containing protein [Candidatus Hydrogenedentes bacterium]|nr:trypsin-like peptidase domain-containing protein [Candidatus Hydrogenedentota bacterium]